jgi:hypothetical protein
MNDFIQRALLCAVVLYLLTSSFAMPSASAQGRSSSIVPGSDVYLVQGIAIYKTVDMQFGDIVPGLTAGTVTLGINSSRTSSGPLLLPSGAVASAAVFVVLGPPNQTFTLSLPSSMTLGRQGGSGTMSVTNFVSNPTLQGTLSSGGAYTVTVGASLIVAANQTFGKYTGSFAINVSYP